MRGLRNEKAARLQSARLSSDVAEVANRPKNRPGKRQRSSITTRRQTMLVWSRAIPGNIYHAKFEARELSPPSLRASGSRDSAPDDTLREAI